MDVLVLKDDKILLVKRTNKILEGGKWGLVGGFVDRDENIKEAASREILEETGWTVSNVELLKINDYPNRPHEDRQNIAFVLYCEAEEKTGSGDWESDDQQWFELESIPVKEEIAFDHYQNIQDYLVFRKTKQKPAILS